MIRAIIYDLDDTLFPEEAFRVSGFRFVAKYLTKEGVPVSLEDLLLLYKEYPRSCFDELVKKYSITQTPLELLSLYKEHIPTISPYPEVTQVLEELHTTYTLGVISDYDHETQQRKLTALGIELYFTHVIFTDAIGTKKPETLAFEKMKELMGCENGEIVYVGDNEEKDFIGARASGYHTVKYLSQGVYQKVQGEQKQKADFEMSDHREIFSILTELSKQ